MTQQRTWKDAYEEVKADLDRAVARNSELAELEDENSRLRTQVADLQKETGRIHGLEQGNKDMRQAVEATLVTLKVVLGELRVTELTQGQKHTLSRLQVHLQDLQRQQGERAAQDAAGKAIDAIVQHNGGESDKGGESASSAEGEQEKE